ncbi:MAG: hypothetical protein ACREL1_08650 [bacterium]
MLKKNILLLSLIFVIGCGSAPPLEINLEQAKKLGDKVALDYFDNNSKDLYPRLNEGFHTEVHNAKDLAKVLHRIRFLYGEPTSYTYKVVTYGHRLMGAEQKSYADVWYVLRTKLYPKGDHYLKIEVLQADGATFLDVGGFGVLDFPKGLPAYLK